MKIFDRMKHLGKFILALLVVLPAACTKNSTEITPIEGIKLDVSAVPAYSGTKTVGTADEGKTAWNDGDVLYLVLGTQADSTACRYRLSYCSGGWNSAEKYVDGSYTPVTAVSCGEEKCRAEIFYAPSYEFSEKGKLSLKEGKTPGIDEYMTWTSGEEYTVDNSTTLSVTLKRLYSRIRISANAGYGVKLACADFTPAGYGTGVLSGYTLYTTADNNGNAFFYGSWAQGSDITVMSYDTDGAIAAEHKYENRDKSEDGNAYAAYCVSSSEEDEPSGGDEKDPTDDDDADDFVNESEFTKVITIVYSGNTVNVSPTNILKVSTSGAHVVLGDTTSSIKNVKLAVSGTTTNGSLKVYNQKKMLLALNGASITSSCGPAVNSQCGKRIYVTLSGTNSLTDASAYTDTVEGEDSKACFFSEGQLIFSGDGSLTIKGNYKHGVASDDYVRVLAGNITVSGAASDAVKVNDYYRQDGGTVKLTAVSDAIQCDNDHIRITGGSLTANTTGNKASGIQATGDIIISGGEVNSTVSGNGSKCLKTDANLNVSGGTVTLKTTGAAYYDSEEGDVSSPACIRSENTCILEGGVISCTSTGKAGKGINAYNFTCKDGADLTVSTAGSYYSYSGDYSYAKGIKATNLLQVDGGTIKVTTTGSGAEGIESKGNLVVNDGRIYIKAYDDAINAAGFIIFNGGYTYAYSTNNDGIDSNYGRSGAIVFNGGVVMAFSAKSPEEGIDADNDAYLTFSGSTVFSSGGKQAGGGGGGGGGGRGSSSPSCSQSTILLGGSSSLSTGYFTVTDSSGNVVFSFYVPRTMSQNYSFLSSPLLKSGTTYKYGTISSKPSNPTGIWENWFCTGGTASVSGGNFTATGSYQNLSGGSSGDGGWGPRWQD